LPTVQLPTGVEVKEGDKATIQVVQLTTSGGALYNVSPVFRWGGERRDEVWRRKMVEDYGGWWRMEERKLMTIMK
jgi:hypothetical protein